MQPGKLQWVETREHMRGNRDISMICNTSHGRWIYHKAQREVAITHSVVCAMFPVLSAGQTAQRPGSWTETAWLSVMKLFGSQVHLPFCIAVSEQSHLQTQWEKPRSTVYWRSFSAHVHCSGDLKWDVTLFECIKPTAETCGYNLVNIDLFCSLLPSRPIPCL